MWSGAGPSDFLHDSLQIHHHGSRNAAFIVTVQSSNKKKAKLQEMVMGWVEDAIDEVMAEDKEKKK